MPIRIHMPLLRPVLKQVLTQFNDIQATPAKVRDTTAIDSYLRVLRGIFQLSTLLVG